MKKVIFLVILVFCSGFAQVPEAVQQADFFQLGNKDFEKGLFRKAVQNYRKAIHLEQNTAFAWFNMGHALKRLNRDELAIVAYKRTSELAPDYIPPWLALGDLFYKNGEIGEAVASFRHALDLGEDSPELHHALGECAVLAGDPTEALKQFETVLKSDPNRTDIYFAMTEVYESLQDYEQASKTLEQALLLVPDAGADVSFYLSYLYEKQGFKKKALRAMEDGLILAPKNISYRRHLAKSYEDSNLPWMAVFVLEEGLELKISAKEKSVLFLDLANIYFMQERYEEALVKYSKALQLGEILARTGIENVGNVYFNAGDKQKADDVYKLMRE